jgi:hypothetical protein
MTPQTKEARIFHFFADHREDNIGNERPRALQYGVTLRQEKYMDSMGWNLKATRPSILPLRTTNHLPASI